jgi:hypothetical protein
MSQVPQTDSLGKFDECPVVLAASLPSSEHPAASTSSRSLPPPVFSHEPFSALLYFKSESDRTRAVQEITIYIYQILHAFARTGCLRKELADVFDQVIRSNDMDWIHLYFFLLLPSSLEVKQALLQKAVSPRRMMRFFNWLPAYIHSHLKHPSVPPRSFVHSIRLHWSSLQHTSDP